VWAERWGGWEGVWLGQAGSLFSLSLFLVFLFFYSKSILKNHFEILLNFSQTTQVNKN
jgi:hypothetical protein